MTGAENGNTGNRKMSCSATNNDSFNACIMNNKDKTTLNLLSRGIYTRLFELWFGESIKSFVYTRQLHPILLPYQESHTQAHFQQANISPYIARQILKFLRRAGVIVIPWPPCSPDFASFSSDFGIVDS